MNTTPMREFNHFPIIEGKVGNGVKFERIRRITGYLVGRWIGSTTPNAPKSATAWRI